MRLMTSTCFEGKEISFPPEKRRSTIPLSLSLSLSLSLTRKHTSRECTFRLPSWSFQNNYNHKQLLQQHIQQAYNIQSLSNHQVHVVREHYQHVWAIIWCMFPFFVRNDIKEERQSYLLREAMTHQNKRNQSIQTFIVQLFKQKNKIGNILYQQLVLWFHEKPKLWWLSKFKLSSAFRVHLQL